ncbi:DUF4870 domain-containing protein [Lysinibacillus sp. NPDC097279]|uniref:DUF4870 domain-containing protein n=1 Tax=unclassified Lysinibacillus TaxID=2636778 RepID=UPI0011224694|nr:DUF4870 domain-containing protein [Lysinibacillus sp. CD3-6]QPQ34254.1 DUF4870 domain-containing protein [Lysinibacillus sp. JNUCC-52]UED79791.1 DUF4870 domain-containing protein [Lysinibacillus sp. CD3-6]
MENQKILSAFSYLSIFFAPFIVPVIVYFVSKDSDVKRHSIRALISHLIPFIFGIIFFIVFVFSTISLNTFDPSSNGNTFIIIWFVSFGIYLLVSLGIVIWNIVQAVRVIR